MDRCQRYTQLIENETNTGMGFSVVSGSTLEVFLRWYYTTPMRVTPTFQSNITALNTGGANQTGTLIAFVNFNTNAIVNVATGTITTTTVQGSTRGCFIKWIVAATTITGTTSGNILALRFNSSTVRCVLSAEL